MLAVDLFDEVAATLSSSNQGRTWFVGEIRILRRFAGIGLSFPALREASLLANLVARNPVPDESRGCVLALLRLALGAWDEGRRADAVAIKALYSFARDEGYPVREDWAAGLRGSDRDNARRLINEPLASLADVEPESVERLLESLRRYLRGHTALLLP
jgi:hypothetical protein